MSKTALVSGIGGQDGSYLAELLLSKGYEVHGIVRKINQNHLTNIKDITPQITLHEGDITDQTFINTIINAIQPHELYHLAAQSFVAKSFQNPYLTLNVNTLGTLNILEAIKELSPHTKMYFAATSEMYGQVQETPQTEKTHFYPRSPYGISKLAAFNLCRNYRESYNLHISNGILFNHESPRRGIEFVTKKITDGIAQIVTNKTDHITLGDTTVKRDWGYAPNYVLAMYLMLQQPTPDDYVIATNEQHSVQEFLEIAFNHVGLNPTHHVRHDPKFLRPAEVNTLQGDYSKAKHIFHWEPKTSFEELIKIMVDYDIKQHTHS